MRVPRQWRGSCHVSSLACVAAQRCPILRARLWTRLVRLRGTAASHSAQRRRGHMARTSRAARHPSEQSVSCAALSPRLELVRVDAWSAASEQSAAEPCASRGSRAALCRNVCECAARDGRRVARPDLQPPARIKKRGNARGVGQ
ncbi:hypothetical protein ERJ75_000475700 [Trypanosoma vivax]|nr:hypothetical protein ERJ75_000475700 [Trypanosoma vivax]